MREETLETQHGSTLLSLIWNVGFDFVVIFTIISERLKQNGQETKTVLFGIQNGMKDYTTYSDFLTYCLVAMFSIIKRDSTSM